MPFNVSRALFFLLALNLPAEGMAAHLLPSMQQERFEKPLSFSAVTEAACTRARPALEAAIAQVNRHGLNPDIYLRPLRRADDTSCQRLNMALTRALSDLRFGFSKSPRLSADQLAAMTMQKNVFWVYALLAPKQAASHMSELVNDAASQRPFYKRLQAAYLDYFTLAMKGGLPRIGAGESLTVGKTNARVERLRRYLILTGDYVPEQWSHIPAHAVYDHALEAALKNFQTRNGLKPDGQLNPSTMAALNTPLSTRLTQLAVAMERARSMTTPTGNYIHVNLPSFTLYAYKNNQPALEMKVIVGAKNNPTPEFSNQITQMVVNPTWTPTARILREEMLPKARSNPSSLRGYQITDRRTGATLDAMNVNWSQMGVSDVQIMQPAGSGNALGKVKFLMPKSDSIYLHDTARPQLFSQSDRALSHGCIRLEKPQDLARYVMNLGRPEEASGLAAAYAGTSSRNYAMSHPLPVVATYFTTWVNDRGQPEFYPDIYNKDQAFRTQIIAEATSRHEQELAQR